jgi:small subunit ribosomal protein S20
LTGSGGGFKERPFPAQVRPRAAHVFVSRNSMANTPQARKRIRRNDRRADVNKSRVSRIRTFVKKVESALESGAKDVAAEALKAAQPEMMRGVSKGVLHKNTVARKIARLSKAVKALG